MYINNETRSEYRRQLISYYFNTVNIKTTDTMSQVRRQVEGMDDNALITAYNRLFNK